MIDDIAKKARELNAGNVDANSEDCFGDLSDGSLLSKVADMAGQSVESDDPEAEARDRALLTAIKHKSWLESRSVRNVVESGVHLNLTTDEAQELERIFGPGAAEHQLAIQHQGSGEDLPADEKTVDKNVDDEDMSDISVGMLDGVRL